VETRELTPISATRLDQTVTALTANYWAVGAAGVAATAFVSPRRFLSATKELAPA
jgi:hypothetical protein